MTTIIECRNKEAKLTPTSKNGQWDTVLPSSIQINEGDTIYIKDSFIDTQASTNEKINITEETLVKIKFGFYRVYNDNTGLDSYTGGGVPVNYRDYTVCSRKVVPTPDPNDLQLIKYLVLTSADGINPTKEFNRLEIKYTDFDGNNLTDPGLGCPVTQPKANSQIEFKNILVRGNIETVPDAYTLESQFNIKITPFTETLEGKNVCTPLVYERILKIDAGNYDPDDLCDNINKQMTDNNPSLIAGGYPVEGDTILQTASQIMADNNLVQNELVLIPDDGNMSIALQYDASKNYGGGFTDSFVGSNQFELSYDQNTKKFSFNYLHMPYYYQKNIAVEIGEVGGQTYEINKLGGIWIESLSSINANDDATNFWELLGLSNTLLPQLRTAFTWLDTIDPIGGQPLFIPTTAYQNGVNVTGGLLSLDKAVDKDNALLPWNNNPITSALNADETEFIEGANSIFDNVDAFGYYIVEIGNKFKNDFYTPTNNYRNVQQIVSKYYVQNSYTTGTSDGSLVYTHKGEPLLLESFQCRILDSNKQLAANVGDDNTIHIAIERGTTQPTKIKKPDEKKEKEEK